MKATCKSPANIAFIKYWGKADEKLRIPANNNLSMCLDSSFTITTVEFQEDLKNDEIWIDEQEVKNRERDRVIKQLDRIRGKVKLKLFAKVVSQNNFPRASGLASSASGMAALTLAGCKAAGLNLSKKELSILARLASGSACRSIPDGFTYWQKGGKKDGSDSYAYSLYPVSYWDLSDITVIVSQEKKKISTTSGHSLIHSSPFFKERLIQVKNNLKKIKKAFKNKDFSLLGKVIESDCLQMHSLMLTSKPALIYWQPATLQIMHKVINWREKGIESYFTIDAGSNVHVICQSRDEEKLALRLKQISGIEKVVINHPSIGARTIKKHLF